MPQSILVFDFGSNEQAAQQARHKVEAWKQGFRLGNKMLLKFEREADPETPPTGSGDAAAGEPEPDGPARSARGGSKSAKKKSAANTGSKSKAKTKSEAEPESAQERPAPSGKVKLLLRLDFSDHEKLSHQRWLDRIPSEEPFKSASGQAVRAGDPEFANTAELFESLD